MFSNSLKITLRSLYREKLYALINITGLALALACCMVLFLYLRSELTYDQHHLNHKQIYRVVNEFSTPNTTESFAATSQMLGPMLAEDYPEVLDYVRFFINGDNALTLHHEDQAYYWYKTFFTDVNVFKVFTHDIIYGDPETALVDPYSIAVSETFARSYFGDENPIGKIITTDRGTNPYSISLVFADLPENTHLKYDVLFSYNNPARTTPDDIAQRERMLGNINGYTYLVMPENYRAEDFRDISKDFFDRHMARIASSMNYSWRSWLQPLADIHLYSDVSRDLPTGNRFYVYAFSAVAFFILLIACINYINLATARSAKRTREVGMRKILGISRASLILQFLAESYIYILIALVLSVVLVEVLLTLTPVNQLLGKSLSMSLFDEPRLLFFLLLMGSFLGLVSGLYPAFYLSSWKPLSALSGGGQTGKYNKRFREGLVLLQFTMSVGVIACTLLMAMQLKYINTKSLGFKKENRVVITLRGADVLEKNKLIETELLKNSRVLGVTFSQSMMGKNMPINAARIETSNGDVETTGVYNMGVTENFLDVMGMELLEGRDFSKKLLTDVGTSYVVNEALVGKMGWDKPLGKRINNGRVIGVVSDFNFSSLHNRIEPFAFTPTQINFDDIPDVMRQFMSMFLVVNIAGDDIHESINFLEQKITEFDPVHPFEFQFLDESLNELYASETRLMKLTGVFAGICIFIACLGLFGLAAFTTEQRTKEIGIRKVLGATTSQIIMLLSKNILMLVISGAVVASIFTWYAVNEWLEGFAYRAEINPLVFLLSAALAAAVAYLTLALQSYKTARANPVNALRYE